MIDFAFEDKNIDDADATFSALAVRHHRAPGAFECIEHGGRFGNGDDLAAISELDMKRLAGKPAAGAKGFKAEVSQ